MCVCVCVCVCVFFTTEMLLIQDEVTHIASDSLLNSNEGCNASVTDALTEATVNIHALRSSVYGCWHHTQHQVLLIAVVITNDYFLGSKRAVVQWKGVYFQENEILVFSFATVPPIFTPA